MMQMSPLVNLGDSGIPIMHHIPTPTGHTLAGPQTQRLMMKHGDEKIVDVWKNDLEDAFKSIRKLINQYNYVAMVSLITIFKIKLLKLHFLLKGY